jgi:hypothetical protein
MLTRNEALNELNYMTQALPKHLQGSISVECRKALTLIPHIRATIYNGKHPPCGWRLKMLQISVDGGPAGEVVEIALQWAEGLKDSLHTEP